MPSALPRGLASLAIVTFLLAAAPIPVAPAANPNDMFVFDEPRDVREIHFSDSEGRRLTLADFRGRVVLVNIWATWCAPCRKEMPSLDRLQKRLGGKDFIVLPVSIDRDGVPVVKRFYQELGLEALGIYVDPAGKGIRALNALGVPTSVLVDRDGREVMRKMGAAEWDEQRVVSLIRGYIEAAPGSKKAAAP